MNPVLVYVAGPYRAASAWEVEQNIRAVEALGAEVAKLGAYPVMPHANTRLYFEGFQPGSFWLAATLELLRRCDAAIFTHDYERSSGAVEELKLCKATAKPYFNQPGIGALLALQHWLRSREAATAGVST